MDQVVLDGKTYVASRKAASECGYAQDYVGQLSRKGFIDAKRVSGQWYVQLDSLKAYKEKAETFKPEPPKYQPDPNVEASIRVDGKEYVSAARAAKAAEYNQDYIAQLARAGKVPSRQMGNRWYVELEALLTHKQEKDAMLRAVQAESVGLKRPEPRVHHPQHTHAHMHIRKPDEPLMSYSKESKPLFPELEESVALKAKPYEAPKEDQTIGSLSKIPIRVLRPITIQAKDEPITDIKAPSAPTRKVAIPRKTMSRAISWQLAIAAVVLLVVGVGAYKRDAIVAAATGNSDTQTASAASMHENIQNILNKMLAKEIVYQRQ